MPNQQGQGGYGGGGGVPSSNKEQFASRGTLGVPVRLLLFSFGLFLFMSLVWAGLAYGYGTFLDNQIDSVEQAVNDLANISEEERERQRELSNFHAKLANLNSILRDRRISSGVFSLLESTVHDDVYYGNLRYSAEERLLEMEAFARSLRSLVEQLSVFDDNENITDVMIDGIRREGSFLIFNLRLEIGRGFFVTSL